jgi:hypothetical protein
MHMIIPKNQNSDVNEKTIMDISLTSKKNREARKNIYVSKKPSLRESVKRRMSFSPDNSQCKSKKDSPQNKINKSEKLQELKLNIANNSNTLLNNFLKNENQKNNILLNESKSFQSSSEDTQFKNQTLSPLVIGNFKSETQVLKNIFKSQTENLPSRNPLEFELNEFCKNEQINIEELLNPTQVKNKNIANTSQENDISIVNKNDCSILFTQNNFLPNKTDINNKTNICDNSKFLVENQHKKSINSIILSKYPTLHSLNNTTTLNALLKDEKRLSKEEKPNIGIMNKKFHKHSKIEKTLTSTLSNKVILIVLVLLVISPMLELEFIHSLDSSYSKKEVITYCINVLNSLLLHSITLNRFLGINFNVHFNKCIELSESEYIGAEKDKIPFIYYLNFTQLFAYKNLIKQEQQLQISLDPLIKNGVYIHPDFYLLEQKRQDADYIYYYYTDTLSPNSLGDSYVEAIISNDQITKITCICEILKIVFIDILVISWGILINRDIYKNVIQQLNNIFTNLQEYFNGNEENFFKNLKVSKNSDMDIINNSIRKLLNLVEIGIDKNSKFK